MQPVTVTPAAIEAFQSFYLAELDSMVQRSEVVGAITLKKGSAALFFEPTEGKFTLVEKLPDVEAAKVFDCVPREQWGRTVMLFGHATNTGGYIASGHATLDGNTIKIKLASGHYYRVDVDPTLAHLQPFVSTEPLKPKEAPPKPEKKANPRNRKNNEKNNVRPFERPAQQAAAPKQQVSDHSDYGDESEDLTEEDLRRLRGEIPLTKAPKNKWKR